MTHYSLNKHSSAPASGKMPMKWEPDSPAIHHIGYETPPPHGPLGRQPWPVTSGTSWEHAFADFNIGMAHSPSTMSTASTPQSSFHDHSLSSLQSCCTSAPSIQSQPVYDHHSHCMNEQSRGLSSWQTPLSSSLSSPCSMMDVGAPDFVDHRHDSAQTYTEWAPMVSPTFSTNSLVNLSTSPVRSSPDSATSHLQWSHHSSSLDSFLDPTDPAFQLRHQHLGHPTSMPQVPVLQSSVEPSFMFQDPSMLDTSGRQMFQDYSAPGHVAPGAMMPLANETSPVLSQGRGRARKPARGKGRTQGAKRSTTRNTITRRCDGAFVVSAPRGKGNVEIYREDDGKWTNPAPKKHRHYCNFPNLDTPCTASFARKEHLTRHQSKHSNKKPWACPLLARVKNTGKIVPCPMTCSRHDNLMDHISTHCRAWLTKKYPDSNKTARRFEVSIEDAERLIIEDQCGDSPDEESLRDVKVKLRQLTRRLKKAFPLAPEEDLTFPMLRNE